MSDAQPGSPGAAAAAEIAAGAARLVEAPAAPETQGVPGLAPEGINPGSLGGGEQPQPVQPAPAQEPVELPNFTADTSGIEDLLEEEIDEFEDETPPPVAVDEEEEYLDDESQKLTKRVRELEKKNKWLEDRRVEREKKEWIAEAKKRFPYAQKYVESLTTTSRRATLKAAHKFHNEVATTVDPLMEEQARQRVALEQQIRNELRGEAANRWGLPATGPSEPMLEHAEQTEQQNRLANAPNLLARTTERLRQGLNV